MREAQYSLETRFIPSLSGVTRRDVGGPVVRREPRPFQAPVDVPDRRPAPPGELAVDLADEAVDQGLVLLVARDVLPARHDDLDERHRRPASRDSAASSVRNASSFCGRSLGVVEPVDPEHDLASRLGGPDARATLATTSAAPPGARTRRSRWRSGTSRRGAPAPPNRAFQTAPCPETRTSGSSSRTHWTKLRRSRTVWNPTSS